MARSTSTILSRLTKPFRILGILAALFLVIIAIGLYFWRPIAIEIMRQVSLAEFRAEHSIGDDELHVIKADADWVYTFGGSRSLPALRRMSTDLSLDKQGQKLAGQLAAYIETGEHVRWYEIELDPKYQINHSWPRRQLTEYICEQDRHLRPKDVQP